MSTLKGQNLRIFMGTTANNIKPIALATNCTINITANTQESKTKDDTSLSSKPDPVSYSWTVRTDSLNVEDIGTLLAAIKNQTLFKVAWDEVGADQKTAQEATFSYEGQAFINDLNFTFNDRENSQKTIQLTGNGALTKTTSTLSSSLDQLHPTKGQDVRLFLGTGIALESGEWLPIAAAKSLTLHISCALEEGSTKDTDTRWLLYEITGITFDISTSALVRSGETITSQVIAATLSDIEDNIVEGVDQEIEFKICNVSGANNRSAGATIMSGWCVISTLSINAQVGSNSTYDAQLQGYGDFTVGA